MATITQSELKKILHYDPDTGILTWIKRASGIRTRHAAGTLNHGYVDIRINGKRYGAHRLAWLWVYGTWPPAQIDHINHVRSDNRLANLRLATNLTNGRNASKRKDNRSGYTGVSWFKKGRKWRAYINMNHKPKHLGCFDTIDEAIAARKQAEIENDYHPNHGGEEI